MDKELLLRSRLPEDDVDIPNVGTVRVRGLSRFEALEVQDIADLGAKEVRILKHGLIDPEMTDAEVRKWQKASPAGELEPVSDKITELSGLLAGSSKEAVQTFRDES